jgi:DmsE family decaheme c-type cytochrome
LARRRIGSCSSIRFFVVRLFALVVLSAAPAAFAEEVASPTAASGAAAVSASYTGGGVPACTECHDQPAILAVLKSPHGVKGDARTPLAHDAACETCHGAGADHAADDEQPIPIAFGQKHPIRPQNELCMSCHQGGTRIHWSGSEHESHDVSCAACHQVHAIEDPVFTRDVRPETFVKRDQSQACFSCHPDVRAQTHRMSTHPIREGRVACSDCHNPHGSTTDHLLAQETLNETCYECHAEKRGPFVWEHQPARDDCSTCHVPHGSNHKSLLAARGPWLCQSCHMASRHPSGIYGGSGLSNASAPNRNLLAKNCTNCHSEVHGTNHPSGVRLTR